MMRVDNLIIALQEMPQDAEVVITTDDFYGRVSTVEYVKLTNATDEDWKTLENVVHLET